MRTTLALATALLAGGCDDEIEEDEFAWTPTYASISSHASGEELIDAVVRVEGSADEDAVVVWTCGVHSGRAAVRTETFCKIP